MGLEGAILFLKFIVHYSWVLDLSMEKAILLVGILGMNILHGRKRGRVPPQVFSIWYLRFYVK